MWGSIQHLSGESFVAILYITYCSTLVGYIGWRWLLSLYPAMVVAPFAMLVPIFSFLSSALFLHEPLQPWKLTAATLVMLGLGINLLAPRLIAVEEATLQPSTDVL